MPELIDNVFTPVVDASKQVNLPNDRGIFLKGLFALIFFIVPGFMISMILTKMCFDDSKIALEAYRTAPHLYKESSVSKVKKGRMLLYIGLGVFIFETIVFLGYISR
jgi:hypothetical protein